MIRLTVISAPATGVASGFAMVFGPGGGTIGRSHQCTWQLTDPDCLISRTHAEIDASNGHYRITDRSTNGLFVNHADAALGFGNSVELRHGDQIHLGHYLLGITLEPERACHIDDNLGPADFLADNIPLLTPQHDAARAAIRTIATAPIAPAFEPISQHWNATMSLNDNTSLHENARDNNDVANGATPDLEQQLRLALQPFAGNMVMDFNQRELLALITYLVGRAKHANATAM